MRIFRIQSLLKTIPSFERTAYGYGLGRGMLNLFCGIFVLLASSCTSNQSSSDEKPTNEILLKGKALYQTNCAACHQGNGAGIPGTHPPLAQTGWVLGSKEKLINVVLKGLQDRIRVHGEVYDGVMPAQPHLKDDEVAAILTYIRNSFGNEASVIQTQEVEKVRVGESLNEKVVDFADVKTSNDYKARKKAAGDRVQSRVGGYYEKGDVLLESINLPVNFKIDVFARGLENPRSLDIGSNGTIFVGTRRNDEHFIYAIRDEDKDWKPDTIIQISKGLKWDPMGVAVRGKDLYVGEIDRIVKYENIEEKLLDVPEPTLIFNYPPVKKHGHKYIRFGPDDKLYIPVGTPCNNCIEDNPIFASITRINPDGSDYEIFAHGVRNSRGYDWHPETSELWFSDNGRDLMGDDIPPCEINRTPEGGLHFGYPFCHGTDISDPEFGSQRPCSDFIPMTFGLVAHAAPVSLKFYTGSMFPEKYRNQILVSEHGSWNRSTKQGYRIMLLTLESNEVVSYEPFITGWLNEEQDDAWGRPVDILQMKDGSLLISDDYSGTIYRVSYEDKSLAKN